MNPPLLSRRTHRIVIRPLAARHLHLDVTELVTQAIAGHLGRLFGGNEAVNQIEAERIFEESLKDLCRQSTEAVPA